MFATRKDGCAFFTSDADVTLNLVELFFGDLRAHQSGLIHRIANFDFLRFLFEATEEFFFDFLFDEQTRAGAAHLSLIEKDSHHRAVHCLIQIGVCKNHVRGFATEFERDFSQVLSRSFSNQLSDFG